MIACLPAGKPPVDGFAKWTKHFNLMHACRKRQWKTSGCDTNVKDQLPNWRDRRRNLRINGLFMRSHCVPPWKTAYIYIAYYKHEIVTIDFNLLLGLKSCEQLDVLVRSLTILDVRKFPRNKPRNTREAGASERANRRRSNNRIS